MKRVTSSLDAGLQRYALAALRRQLRLLDAQNVNDGAVLVVDNASGEVLAYVGNSGPDSSARFVDGVQAPRQPGSALKPFLYELAIERHLITAASLIDDSPVNLVTPSGLYVPQNYDLDFKGLVSARTALSGSLNVPAVRTLMKVGPDAYVTRLRALGFDGITEDGDYYGYALALGSAEVRLWALVNAFRTLANGGVWSPLALTPQSHPPHGRRVMDAAAAWIVTDILSDRGARSVTFGLDSPLATPFWSAVKTGTSSDMRDNWCIGFTPRYTVGVWIGNFSGAPMQDVSGVSGAAPLWLGIMDYLNRGGTAAEPAPPAGVISRHVVFAHGVEPARDEWFLPDTAVSRVALKPAHSAQPRIVYPRIGTIIALDPDIPAGHQRVRLQMRPGRAGFVWRVDGQRVAAHDGAALWQPRHGTHTVTLQDARGTEIDAVTFKVRGSDVVHADAAQ
jgi:penicillin-binding protein 1C